MILEKRTRDCGVGASACRLGGVTVCPRLMSANVPMQVPKPNELNS